MTIKYKFDHNRFNNYLNDNGIDILSLSISSGVSASMISMLRNGKSKPSLEKYHALLSALMIKDSELFLVENAD